MKFKNENALIYIPNNRNTDTTLSNTDILCIAAHQDDTEIMAYHAIEECSRSKDKFFTSVIVTDGGGSPRTGEYSDYTDEEMKLIRIEEQNKAAEIGEYLGQIQLAYPSAKVKENDKNVVDDIALIIKETKPKVIYTHNLADKHKTHVAVALRVISALQEIKKELRPEKLIGLEVWRGLDWMNDEDKMVYDASKNRILAEQLLEVFDSQIAGGKRYDKAAIGRRLANATFFGDHRVDEVDAAIYGINMTELMDDDNIVKEFITKQIDNFKNRVSDLIDELS